MWVESATASRRAEVLAGQAYLRLHLAATKLGLSLQPMGQLLEEYPEMEAPRRALYEALGVGTRSTTVQMLARIGYGERIPPRRAGSSPRSSARAVDPENPPHFRGGRLAGRSRIR